MALHSASIYGISVCGHIMTTFLLIHAIWGMGNVLRNSSILESAESTQPYRDDLRKTNKTQCGVYSNLDRLCVHIYDARTHPHVSKYPIPSTASITPGSHML